MRQDWCICNRPIAYGFYQACATLYLKSVFIGRFVFLGDASADTVSPGGKIQATTKGRLSMAKGAAPLPITRQELGYAWRTARSLANASPRNNMHRLMLFYATECGLKAIYLKRENLAMLKKPLGHNLNHILDKLQAGSKLHLPKELVLQPCTSGPSGSRSCEVQQINQVWRYGAELLPPNDDAAIEAKLLEIDQWIAIYI